MLDSSFDSYETPIQEILYEIFIEMKKESAVYDPEKYAEMMFSILNNKFGSSKEEDAHQFLGYIIGQFSNKTKQKLKGIQEQSVTCASCAK